MSLSLLQISSVSGLYADIGSHARLAFPSAIISENHRRIPTVDPERLFLHTRAHNNAILDHRSTTIGNAYATDRTHPHVKNTFSLAIGIRRPHARSIIADHRILSFTLFILSPYKKSTTL